MYQVIKMYGDLEPWWFLEGWKDDVVETQEFGDYYEALKYYKKEWFALMDRYPSFNSKSSVMTAFWDSKDQRWCEECGEDLQQYYSLALLKDWEAIPKDWYRPGYARSNDNPLPFQCQIKTPAGEK